MERHRRSEDALRIDVVETGADSVRVTVAGEVDFLAAPRLKARLSWVLAEFEPRDIVVNLSGVSFLDSTGRGALLRGWRLAQERNCRLTVVNPQRPVLAMLRMAGVAGHLGLEATASD